MTPSGSSVRALVTSLCSDPLSPRFAAPTVGGKGTLLFRVFATDTDGDGFDDGSEVTAGSDPLDEASVP